MDQRLAEIDINNFEGTDEIGVYLACLASVGTEKARSAFERARERILDKAAASNNPEVKEMRSAIDAAWMNAKKARQERIGAKQSREGDPKTAGPSDPQK